MNQETKTSLDNADYIKVVQAEKLNRFVYQTYEYEYDGDSVTGGGELEVLIEWLQQLNTKST